MVKLVSETGHWALRDNSMIFCNVIWESSYKDCLKYHLIDDEHNELPFNLDECCQPVKLPWEHWTEEESAATVDSSVDE